MNDELKLLKKKYGEKMMHYLRNNFSSILEEEGKLSELMFAHFDTNHSLYDDLVNNNKLYEFKNYLYNFYNKSIKRNVSNIKTPKEIFNSIGYDFYEVKTEEEIQSFKKYYDFGEELCTFNGGRLDTCYIFWVVKKNLSKIKRSKEPRRQDEYGTSVMSIQFTKDNNYLSIKNRYNHSVINPDATYSNDLENIYPGLTDSFEKTYGIIQKNKCHGFEMPGYVMANDSKFYKYNYEINNVYYCPNNIIIDNFEVIKYEKEKYLIMDYFILDLMKKKIFTYDLFLNDDFTEEYNDITKIEIIKENDNKKILIDNKKKIILDKNNKIIGNYDPEINVIEDNYLLFNKDLKEIELPNVEYIGHSFLSSNEEIKKINFPKVKSISNGFLRNNRIINEVNLLNVISIGSSFLNLNEELEYLSLPNLKKVGDCFLNFNIKLKNIFLPNLEYVGDFFLFHNKDLDEISLPNLKYIHNSFLQFNANISKKNIKLIKK